MLYSGRILFLTKLNNKLVLGFQEYEYFCTLSRHKKHMKLLLKLQRSSFRGSNIHMHIYFILFATQLLHKI